jgi:pimeloyl-ACP methyl ester carboxylesterase
MEVRGSDNVLVNEELNTLSGDCITYCKCVNGGGNKTLVIALHYQTNESSRGAGRSVLSLLFVEGLKGIGDAVFVAPDAPLAGKPWRMEKNANAVWAVYDDAFLKHPALDRKRVLLVGYSLGGGGCWTLGQSRPERPFCAVIPVAGVVPKDMKPENWTLPVYAIHSEGDHIVPIQRARELIESLRKMNKAPRVEFTVIRDVDHFNLTDYVDVVKQAVPWLQELWGDGGKILNPS